MDKTDTHNISLGTLYEFNKQIMSKQNSINDFKLEVIKKKLEDWFNQQIDGYAMLLCREKYDFTIFHLYENQNPNPPKIAVTELIDLLKNRGEILSIEQNIANNYMIDNSWEIWLKIDEEAFAYYLFACDDWVIEC